MTTQLFAPGGYRFIPGVFQYSGGAAAEPGYRIERVTFRNPIPLERGFERIEAILEARGRQLTAFCACELRSPAPFTDSGFQAPIRTAASKPEAAKSRKRSVKVISTRSPGCRASSDGIRHATWS